MLKNPPIGLQTKICLLHSKSDLQSPTRQMNRWNSVGEGEIQRCSPSTATHPAVILRRNTKQKKKKHSCDTMCITVLCVFQRAVLFPSICPRLPRRLDGGKSVPGWWQRGRQLVCDGVDARRCLRCEDARWYRGGLPGHPADCLRVTVPSANTYGSPAAAQCALQVSQRLRRSVSLCVWLYCACIQTSGLQKYFYTLCTFPHLNVWLDFCVKWATKSDS